MYNEFVLAAFENCRKPDFIYTEGTSVDDISVSCPIVFCSEFLYAAENLSLDEKLHCNS